MKNSSLTWRALGAVAGLGWGSLAASAQGPAAVDSAAPAGAVLDEIKSFMVGQAELGLSGVLVIFRDGKPALRWAHGYGDRERMQPLRADMVFDIGSITKSFTAAAVLRLEADGKLRLSDALPVYFAGVPDDKAGITVEHLLRHTSGLPQVFGADEDNVTKDWVLAQALQAKLLSAPGAEENYSDAGYSLLAMIIEKVSGRAFEDYVREVVFRPAGMEQTGYMLPRWTPDELACGFRDGAPWGTVRDYYGADGPSWNVRGNGAMLSTAGDLARWSQALLDEMVLPELQTALLVRAHSGTSRATGHRVLSWSGNNLIFSSFCRRWLDDPHGTTVVLFTNTSDWPYEREGLLPPLLTLVGRIVGPPPAGAGEGAPGAGSGR